MFLINPGRYIIADPALVLKDDTFRKLWSSSTRFESYILKTENGVLLALPTGKNGEFQTDLGKAICTETAHIAFIPYLAAEKLLPFDIIRISLTSPALLYFDANNHIVLDGKLTIFC